ncbi:hypothetical protein APSETT444_007677 [Aspergillus pseudonomiae]
MDHPTQNALLSKLIHELGYFRLRTPEQLQRRRNWRFPALRRSVLVKEEDILRRMRNLRRLVVVIDLHFFRCLVGGGYIRGEYGAIDYDADDLVRLVSEGVGESTEVVRVVDWEVPEEESAVAREVFGEGLIARL